MLKASTRQLVRDSLASLQSAVKVILFTADSGCDACPSAEELAQALKGASPKAALEQYNATMDRDKTEEYGITRIPSFVVQARDGRCAAFSGSIDGISLIMLLDAIAGLSAGRRWLPEQASTPLRLLTRGVRVQVFVENDCSLCKPVAETALGVAFTNKIVSTEIVVADDYPEAVAKLSIKILPTTFFGSTVRFEGHADEDVFFELLFQAEEQHGPTGHRCVVCGKDSPGTICTDCKERIRAEAVSHKRAEEAMRTTGTVVKPRRNP